MVPVIEVVVNCLSARCRTHHLCLRRQWVYIWPASLWSFSIGATNSASEIERKRGLTWRNMCRQVEFGYQKRYMLPRQVDVKIFRKCHHAFPQVNMPLTNNVIWRNETNKVGVFETWEEQIIHVYVSKDGHIRNNFDPSWWDLLFAFLEVSDRAGSLQIVTDTIHCANSSCGQVLRAFGVRVLYRMMFYTGWPLE